MGACAVFLLRGHSIYMRVCVWRVACVQVHTNGEPPSPRYQSTMTLVGHRLFVLFGSRSGVKVSVAVHVCCCANSFRCCCRSARTWIPISTRWTCGRLRGRARPPSASVRRAVWVIPRRSSVRVCILPWRAEPYECRVGVAGRYLVVFGGAAGMFVDNSIFLLDTKTLVWVRCGRAWIYDDTRALARATVVYRHARRLRVCCRRGATCMRPCSAVTSY